MVKYRLTVKDVELALNGDRTRRRTSTMRGKTLAPRYRNPANKNETWAGRGLQPKCLVALVKQGKTLEDLAI